MNYLLCMYHLVLSKWILSVLYNAKYHYKSCYSKCCPGILPLEFLGIKSITIRNLLCQWAKVTRHLITWTAVWGSILAKSEVSVINQKFLFVRSINHPDKQTWWPIYPCEVFNFQFPISGLGGGETVNCPSQIWKPSGPYGEFFWGRVWEGGRLNCHQKVKSKLSMGNFHWVRGRGRENYPIQS